MSKAIHFVQAVSALASMPHQDVTAMKQRLANAVQKSAGSSVGSLKTSQSETKDTVLDELLAVPPPQHSRQAILSRQACSDKQMMAYCIQICKCQACTRSQAMWLKPLAHCTTHVVD